MPEEPTTLVTQAALESLAERLRRDGVAYHYALATLSRRSAFEEATRVTMALEEVLDVPVNFDRMDGNHFELWVEGWGEGRF
jgi:hypothetical protein